VAKLRPSFAPIWSKCAISPALAARYPEQEDSPKAREGTAAHFYVTEAVQGREHPVGTLAPNGHPIDADMITHGASFVQDVGGKPEGAAMGVERHLTMHGTVHPECEGTPDAYLIDYDAKVLIVWDYKYGHGYVEPYENAQLIAYAAGVIEGYELDAADLEGFGVSLRIVQPRNYDAAGPVRRWDLDGPTLWRHIEALSVAADRAAQPDAEATTGAHCRYCPANAHCSAAQGVALAVVDMAGAAVPREMPPAELGAHLLTLRTGLQRLSAHIDAVEAVVEASIRRGEVVPQWEITHGRARERWSRPLAEVFAMGDMMGVDLRKPPEPVTPNEARKAGLDDAVIAAYSERPTGSAKLTPRDPKAAAKAFT